MHEESERPVDLVEIMMMLSTSRSLTEDPARYMDSHAMLVMSCKTHLSVSMKTDLFAIASPIVE